MPWLAKTQARLLATTCSTSRVSGREPNDLCLGKFACVRLRLSLSPCRISRFGCSRVIAVAALHCQQSPFILVETDRILKLPVCYPDFATCNRFSNAFFYLLAFIILFRSHEFSL